MIIDKPGPITDRICLLGRQDCCVYLLKGDHDYSIIGGGSIHIIPDMMDQINQFQIDVKKIQRIIILHTHFDHCSIVPYVKKQWPWMQVITSERGESLLSKEHVIQNISFLCQCTLDKYNLTQKAKDMGISFSGIQVDHVVKDNDTITSSPLTLQSILVPGHSSCSIAVYVPEEKAMFGSDAGGIPVGEQIFTAANSNFDLYEASLYRMSQFDVAIYLAEHYGAVTGTDGQNFLKKSLESAKSTRAIIEEKLNHHQTIQECTKELTTHFLNQFPPNTLPQEIIFMVTEMMVKSLAKNRK